jgi:hypothetical protein
LKTGNRIATWLSYVSFIWISWRPSWSLLYGSWIYNYRLFEICFHFAGHRSSTQEFSAGPSEFLTDLHFLCKIVLKPSNVVPLLVHLDQPKVHVNYCHHLASVVCKLFTF